MPELPEVETVRRGLIPVMEGRRIERARVNRPDLRFPLPEAMAERLKTYIYAVGGSVDPEDAYKAFRGKLPSPEAMLEKKGLAA